MRCLHDATLAIKPNLKAFDDANLGLKWHLW